MGRPDQLTPHSRASLSRRRSDTVVWKWGALIFGFWQVSIDVSAQIEKSDISNWKTGVKKLKIRGQKIENSGSEKWYFSTLNLVPSSRPVFQFFGGSENWFLGGVEIWSARPDSVPDWVCRPRSGSDCQIRPIHNSYRGKVPKSSGFGL